MKTSASSVPVKRRAQSERSTKATSVKARRRAGADADMLADYSHLDWSQGVRAKYFEPAMRAQRLVEIDPDVLAAFSSSADINAALRSVMQAASHVQAKRPSGKSITR